MLDAGHIAVESDLADKDKIQEVKSKRSEHFSDDDQKQLEDLMYDRFSLQLQAAQASSLPFSSDTHQADLPQLLMGPSVQACMQAIEEHHASTESDLHILERINMSFSIQMAISNSSKLTRFKVAGDLPELQLNFSDRKYSTSTEQSV